ncbi:sugar ABC transporter ATP-binding protein [Naasia sp. SYSU D00057]|uniref:sugar ABC transporter ATP-binding protein n=1 Tax=Naasia sp. SYSU D00057 TaxID=2817380 RepID=UPI001B3065B1|nr:sugar ABC transporter ATP-binding protein [Naasia sp. SYSU D00057]
MPLLSMTGVHKRYGGVRALDGASLSLEAGEVHGLLGPNGSGKSTLNKVLAGTVSPDAATIELDGQPITIGKPRDAAARGIAAVYQQLSLVDSLTVGRNLTLGVEPTRAGFVDNRASAAEIDEVLERLRPGLGPGVTATTEVSSLTPGQQQLVEIAKAVLRRPRILILDEATASLHRDQVQLLFEIIRELTAAGTCVVFVSHRLEEVMTICDRATILRTGRTVATLTIAETSESELVRTMVGDVAQAERRAELARTDDMVLRVRGLTAPGVSDVDLDVHRGEILGLGGLQGQGQSELLLALFGATPIRAGEIELNGRRVANTSVVKATGNGFALVPGDRGSQGLFMQRAIQENLSIVSLRRRLLAALGISMRRERGVAADAVQRLSIKIGGLDDPVTSLSGGNAQKVVIAKWLLNEPAVVLLDDPTKGVDISAKAEIYAIVRELADSGVAVILNSSDDVELAELCDRVIVLYEGRIRTQLVGDEITSDRLVAAALLIGEGDQGTVDETVAAAPDGSDR